MAERLGDSYPSDDAKNAEIQTLEDEDMSNLSSSQDQVMMIVDETGSDVDPPIPGSRARRLPIKVVSHTPKTTGRSAFCAGGNQDDSSCSAEPPKREVPCREDPPASCPPPPPKKSNGCCDEPPPTNPCCPPPEPSCNDKPQEKTCCPAKDPCAAESPCGQKADPCAQVPEPCAQTEPEPPKARACCPEKKKSPCALIPKETSGCQGKGCGRLPVPKETSNVIRQEESTLSASEPWSASEHTESQESQTSDCR